MPLSVDHEKIQPFKPRQRTKIGHFEVRAGKVKIKRSRSLSDVRPSFIQHVQDRSFRVMISLRADKIGGLHFYSEVQE